MTVNDEARKHSDQITRDRQKETGEIFTPLYLVDEMIEKAGLENLALGKTWFEPAAGDGNFVVRIIERKLLTAGFTKANAVQTVKDVYACEYMLDNRETIVKRIVTLLKENSCYSASIKAVLTNNIAYCNTIDPWDTSDGRKYPSWLIKSLSNDQWESMKGENYIQNPFLFDRDKPNSLLDLFDL